MAYNALTGEGSSYESFTSGLSKLVNDYVQRDVAIYRGRGFDIPDVEDISVNYREETFNFGYKVKGREYTSSIYPERITDTIRINHNKELNTVSTSFFFEQPILLSLKESFMQEPKELLDRLSKSHMSSLLEDVPIKSSRFESHYMQDDFQAPRLKNWEETPSHWYDGNPFFDKYGQKASDTSLAVGANLSNWEGFIEDYESLFKNTIGVNPKIQQGIDAAKLELSNIKVIHSESPERRALFRSQNRDRIPIDSVMGQIYNNPELNQMEKANKAWEVISREVLPSSIPTPTLVPNNGLSVNTLATYTPGQHRIEVRTHVFLALVEGMALKPDEVSTLVHELTHARQTWGVDLDQFQDVKNVKQFTSQLSDKFNIKLYSPKDFRSPSGQIDNNLAVYVSHKLSAYELDSQRYTPAGRVITNVFETDAYIQQYQWLKDTSRYKSMYGLEYSFNNEVDINAIRQDKRESHYFNQKTSQKKSQFSDYLDTAKVKNDTYIPTQQIVKSNIAFLGINPELLFMTESSFEKYNPAFGRDKNINRIEDVGTSGFWGNNPSRSLGFTIPGLPEVPEVNFIETVKGRVPNQLSKGSDTNNSFSWRDPLFITSEGEAFQPNRYIYQNTIAKKNLSSFEKDLKLDISPSRTKPILRPKENHPSITSPRQELILRPKENRPSITSPRQEPILRPKENRPSITSPRQEPTQYGEGRRRTRSSALYPQKLLPPAKERLVNTTSPLNNSTLFPYPSFDHYYSNIQPHQLQKPYIVPYINDLRGIEQYTRDTHQLGPSKLKPTDVEVIPGLDEVNKRQDVENRFRQSYLNEANRKGFNTVDVDVLSSTYESKPYVKFQADIEPDYWGLPLPESASEPKVKTKLERRFEQFERIIDKKTVQWHDPTSITYAADWNTEVPSFFKEKPKDYITGYMDLIDTDPNLKPLVDKKVVEGISSITDSKYPTLSAYAKGLEEVLDPFNLTPQQIEGTSAIRVTLPTGDVAEFHGGWFFNSEGKLASVREYLEITARSKYEPSRNDFLEKNQLGLVRQMDDIEGLENQLDQWRKQGFDTSRVESKLQTEKDRIKTQMYQYQVFELEPPAIGTPSNKIDFETTRVVDVSEAGKAHKKIHGAESVEVGHITFKGYYNLNTTWSGNRRILRSTEVILDVSANIPPPPSPISPPSTVRTNTHSVTTTPSTISTQPHRVRPALNPSTLNPLPPPVLRPSTSPAPSILKPKKNQVMGTLGYIGLAYVGIGVALRGTDYLSYVSSGITSFFTGMTTENPYDHLIVPGGHRVIPDVRSSPAFTTSRADSYADGYRIRDVSIPSAAREDYTSIKDSSINTGVALTFGALGGVGALTLDKALTSFSKAQAHKNTVFKHVFDNKISGAFSKNFSPLLIGAATGAIATDGDIGDRLQGAYLGAVTGSFIGYIGMKEEIGPQFNKKMGLAIIGIGAGLVLASNYMNNREERLKPTPYALSKDGSVRVTYQNLPELIQEGRGQLPPDFYQHPDAIQLARAHLNTSIERTNINTVETSGNYADDIFLQDISKKDGRFKTRLGHLAIGLDMKVPTYSEAEGFKRVSQAEVKERYAIDSSKENPMDRAGAMFNVYQAALFLPSMALFGAGLVAEATGHEGVKNIINKFTSYPDKLRFIWPGEREIGQGMTQLASGVPNYLRRGEVGALHSGLAQIGSGLRKKTTGEIFSLARKVGVYTVPLVLMSSIFQGIARNRDLNLNFNTNYKEVSHFDYMEVIMPESTGDAQLDRFIEAQRYIEEGTATRIGDSILYDSGTIGQGLRNFLEMSPDKSIKGLLYKLGHEEGLLEVMSRKAAIGGLGISGGENISTSGFLDEFGELILKGEGSWSHILSYPIRAAKFEGFGSAINTITSPLVGGIYNFIVTNLGFDPIYNYKFDEERGNAGVAQALNASTFAALGFTAGLSVQSLLTAKGSTVPLRGRFGGALVGGLIGVALGMSLPTHIDKGFYDSFAKQSQLSLGVFKEAAAHTALIGDSNKGVDLAIGTALTAGTPAMIAALLPGTTRNRFNRAGIAGMTGYLVGMGLSAVTGNGFLPSWSSVAKNFHTQGYDLTNQTFSILRGVKRTPGEVKLTHIHSKTLWNEEEIFISAGNLDTVWKGNFGDESQFNLAIRIRGEKAKPLIAQLNSLHEFMKGVKSSDSLEEIAAITPDLVLGGRGSGSQEKILSFIQQAQGDLWISAPYLAGLSREVRPLVEAIKQLEARGQNVHLIAQNPRGVSAGGQPQFSIALQRELMAAGVDIYTSPYTSKELAHSKFLADDNRVLHTSHNIFSGNSMNQVLEIGMILNGKEYADAVKQAALRFMIKANFSNLKDNPEYSPEVYVNQARLTRTKELGIDPQLGGLLGDRQSGSLLLNTQMGASFFYSRALYNNLQRQAGYHHRVIDYKDVGPASSLYKNAHLANINKTSYEPVFQNIVDIPFFVKQFDKELLTQGLGGLFNEFVSMPLGLGRLYKDEVGFLPSLAGTIGAVLDKTYLYSSGTPTPGINVREDTLDRRDQRYKERAAPAGLFETLFTEAFFLSQQASAAIAFYMVMGEPLNLLISEGLKTEMEGLIKVALNMNPKEFTSSPAAVARGYTLGVSTAITTSPLAARLDVSMAIDRTKDMGGYYSDKNMDLSPYHLTNLFMRKRSGFLLDEIMKPFLIDYVNPYTRSHKESQEGFTRLITDIIEEIKKPIAIEYELVGRSSGAYGTITGKRASLAKRLTDIGIQDISAEVIGYQEIRTKFLSAIESTYTQLGRQAPRLADLKDITTAVKAISTSGDESLISTFKENVKEIKVRDELRKYTDPLPGQAAPKVAYTSEGELISSMEFKITNLGQDRASIVAQKIQGLLDEIPLNPLRWGVFNKYSIVGLMLGEWKPGDVYEGGYQRRESDGIVYTKVKTIGDLLSFSELTEITRDLLFGKGGISSFMAHHEVHRPSNAAHSKAKQIALNATDRIHTVWNTTVGFGSQAAKRIWDRYFLIMGTPFHNNGLLRSTDALKAMEYNLVNTQSPQGIRGITWGDDSAKVKFKVKELNDEGLRLWNALYSLVESDDELKALSSLRATVKDEALEAFLRTGDRTGFLNHYTATNLPKDINPMTRQINVIDSSVVYAMEQVQAVDADIRAKGLGPKTHISIQEHLRNQMIGTFSLANMSDKQLAKRLIKIGPGNAFDATGKVTKNKFITNVAWALVTGTLFLESLFANTSGVSLFSQVGAALTMGGGLLSPLLGNEEGEMNLGVQFAGNRLLPGSGPMRYVAGITASAAMLGAAHMLGAASLREGILEYSVQTAMLKRTVGVVQADGASVDVSIKYKPNSASDTGQLLLSELVQKDWRDLNSRQIVERLKSSTLNVGGQDIEVSRIDYVFSMNSRIRASIQATVEQGQLVSRTLTFSGSAYRNTAIAYAVLALGSRAALTMAAGTLNYLRDNTGSMDPILFAGIGLLAGAKLGKSFGGGLLGVGIGVAAGTFMNKVLNQRILSIGTKGTLVNNTQGQIVSELSDFRSRVIGNLDNASRAELMAALWAGKLATAHGLLEREDTRSLVKVQAKQVVLPFLQFFLVSRTMNERRDFQGNITDPGQTYFQVGIQGPPVTGMSLGIGLPFKLIRGKGVFGLVANEEYDVADLMQDAVTLSASIQATAFALNVLDKGVTASGKVFKRVTGASVSTASQLQRRSTLSLVSNALSDIGAMVEDLGLILPNNAVRMGTSLPGIEFRLLADAVPTKAKLKPQSVETPKGVRAIPWAPIVVKAISGGFIGGAVAQLLGTTVGPAVAKDFTMEDWSVGGSIAGATASVAYESGKLITMKYLANTPIANNRFTKALGKIHPTNLPRFITRHAKHTGVGLIYAGALAMGYFLSSSGSGVSMGMDDDIKHQLGVTATYGVIMGTIATQVNHMGKGMSSTMETYTRMAENVTQLTEQLHKGDKPNTKFITEMKLTYSKFRLRGVQKDAEDVIAVLINNKAEIEARVKLSNPQSSLHIKNSKLKTITDSISSYKEATPTQLLNTQAAKDITSGLKDVRGSFLEGRFRNRTFARRLWNTMKVPIVASLVGGMVYALNPEINVDTFLADLEGIGPGHEKYRERITAGKARAEKYIRDVAADTFKIIFFQDRDTNSRIMLDKVMRSGEEYGGMPDASTYSKLLSTNRGLLADLNKIHSEISSKFILDDTNTFISVGIVGGTFRRKEYGTMMTPYVQMQAASSDVSTAAYSMASSYLFRSMMSGKNDLLFDVQNSMRFMNEQTQLGRGNDRRVLRLTALKMLGGTARLQPRTKARRISRIADGVLSAITKDSLLSSILKHRVEMNRNTNFQPYESLISRLLKEQANASNIYLDKMMKGMLDGKGGPGNDITALFMGDPFFLVARNFNITSVKFFGKDRATGDVKATPGPQTGDPGDIWGDFSSPYLDSYMPKEKNLMDNPVVELLGRLFNSLPGPMGFVGKVAAGASAAIMAISWLHNATTLAESRALTTEVVEYFNKDWFGKVKNATKDHYVWQLRYAHPALGEKTYIGGSSPLLFKGSYIFQLNQAFFSGNVRQAFNQIQEDLDFLVTRGWGAYSQPVSNKPNAPTIKQGYSLTDYLVNVKEKELLGILNNFEALPDTFQDINDSKNSFVYERGKDIHHNLDRIEQAIKDSTDEPFKLKLQEEKAKLTSQIDSLTGAKGREKLIGALTDSYGKELDAFVDNYIDTLAKQEISIHRNYLATTMGDLPPDAVDKLGLPWDPKTNTVKVSAISLFAVDADLPQLVAVSNLIRDDMDAGLQALLELMGDEQKKSFMVGDTANIKLFLKTKARADIETALRLYLQTAGDTPEDIIKFLGKIIGGETPELTNLSVEVLGSLTGIKGNKDSFFNRMRHHWGGLARTPSKDYKRVLERSVGVLTNWIIGQAAPAHEVTNPSASSYTAHPYLISHARGKVDPKEVTRMVDDKSFIDKVAQAQGVIADREGLTSKAVKAGGVIWEIYSLANDILEAMNVFSAFSNLADSYGNRNLTDAQRLNYAYEAGMVTTNLAFSIGIMTAGVHLGMLAIGSLTAGAGAMASIGIPLLAGAAVIGVSLLGYNLLPEKQKIAVKGAIDSTYETTGRALKAVGDFAYHVGSNVAGEQGGALASRSTLGAMGGALAGVTTAVSLGTFSLFSAAVLGTTLLSAPLLGTIALVGLGVGAVAGAVMGALGGGKVINSWMDKLANARVGGNQIFRAFINRPGDWLASKNMQAPIRGTSQHSSPLQIMTVGQAVQQDYSSMLNAASDLSGGSAASLFMSPTIYGGTVGEMNPHMRKYGHTSILRPGGVSDPLLDREFRLRGQAFNQTIIGRYTWSKILESSLNVREVRRATEAYLRNSQEEQRVKESVQQVKNVVNDLKTNELKADTLIAKKGLSTQGIAIATNILNLKKKVEETQEAKANKSRPLKVTVNMSNVNDREREFEKDVNVANREVTLVSDGNIVRVIPSIESNIKEAVFNPVTASS